MVHRQIIKCNVCECYCLLYFKMNNFPGCVFLLLLSAFATNAEISPKGILTSGGFGSNNEILPTLELYSPCTNSSKVLSFHLNQPRFDHISVVLDDGRVLVAGGDNFDLDSTEIIDLKAGNVKTVGPLNTGRTSASAAVFNGKAAVCGGRNSGYTLKSCEAFNGKKWTKIPSLLKARTAPAMAAVNSALFVIGGGSDHQPVPRPTNSVQKYDGHSWTLVTSATHKRWYAAAAEFNGFIVVCGGRDEMMLHGMKTCEKYNAKDDKWITFESMSTRRGLNGFSLVVFDAKLFAVGGDEMKQYPKTIESSDANTKKWSLEGGMVVQRKYPGASVALGKC